MTPARSPRRRVRESLPARDTARTAYDRILAIVRRIPRGRVATYGQVAALAGYPHAPRLAGYALHALPEGTDVPWHRVLGAGGKLSLGRLSPEGASVQKLRLELEGVRFTARGTVDLARCRWKKGLAAGEEF